MDGTRIGGEYVILQGEQPVGILRPVAGHEGSLCSHLAGAGYAVTPVAPKPAGEVHSLDGECTEEQPRHCELSVAVGYARDLAADAGIEAPELAELAQNGYRHETEILRALEATRDRLTGDAREEADEVIQATFGQTAATPHP